MFSTLPIEGRWHICGESSEASYGRLFLDPEEGLKLEVKEIKVRHLQDLLTRSEKKDDERPLVIQGYNSNNVPIRLFGCVPSGSNRSMGLASYTYSVARAVTNLGDVKWAQIVGKKFYFTLGFLDRWVNPSGDVADPDGPCVDCDYETEQLKLTVGATRFYNEIRGNSVRESHWIAFDFPNAVSVKETLNEKSWALSLLLSLLAGRTMRVSSFQFTNEGDHADLTSDVLMAFKQGEKPAPDKKLRMRSVFNDVKESFGVMVGKWLSMIMDEDMRQVLNLYTALKYHQLYIGAHFLLVAQALEAYHTACRRFSTTKWPETEFNELKQRVKAALLKEDLKKLGGLISGANNKSFAERLLEVCEDAPAQARKIVPDFKSFVETVKDNRNAYTHHVGKQAHAKRLREGALCSLARQGMALLELLLLRDAMAPAKVLDDIVRVHKTAIYYDLSEE